MRNFCSPPNNCSLAPCPTCVLSGRFGMDRPTKYRFPANYTADRAAEDGGGEASKHSLGLFEGPLQAPLLSAHARRRRIEKRCDIVKTIPGRRTTLRFADR